MTIRNLQYLARPLSAAVIGASSRDGSVGRVVFDNILDGGFEGEVWPVNPKYQEIRGRQCYRSVAKLPGKAELAVVVTPPETVPRIIGDLGAAGTRAAVVITAGLNQDNGLRQAMLDAARPYLMRIVGPNTVGLIVPPIGLNASFSHIGAKAGDIALLSQSGALVTTLMDWAADEDIGFSQIVSLGDMADADAGDFLDMLAGDAKTRAILMYLETIPNPRKFMSAARAAARIKPVIAIKSGRHEAAAKAAATHTGALSGVDRVVDAALRRAGVLRVQDLDELFTAAETVARFRPLKRARVGIVTNGGGAGVLAVDRLLDRKGELAVLSRSTLDTLDKSLPANWSRGNPVDIIGDAPPARYASAIEIVAADDGTDAVLVMNCPTGLASSIDAAEAVAGLARDGMVNGKPVVACWLGEKTARGGREILQAANIASFDTPDAATGAISHLADWSRAQSALMRVPSSISEDSRHDRDAAAHIMQGAAHEGRSMLTEPEAKGVLAAYGIPVPESVIAKTPAEVERAAAELLRSSEQIVVKVLSRTVSHKSDIGGVVLAIETSQAARDAAAEIEKRFRAGAPEAAMDGFVVQPMIRMDGAHELIAGVSRDPIFGPVLLFGAGGTSVEVVDDTAIALPPIDDVLAGDLIDSTRISRLLAGYRDRKPADRAAIVDVLNAVSRITVDFPGISGMDINPLLASDDGVMALDARIEIDPQGVDKQGPNRDLAIRPYPAEWQKDMTLGGREFHLRPVKPSDFHLYPDFLAKVSPDDIRLRLLATRRHFPDEMLVRLTQLDYEREIAFVALDKKSEKLAGIGRLSCDPDKERAEFALLVRTDMQGMGLGWELLGQLIAFAKAEGIGEISGTVLNENTTMLAMCREYGFDVHWLPDDPGLSGVSLKLR